MGEQSVDVLIVTAVQDEYLAVRDVNTGAVDPAWTERKPDGVHKVSFRMFRKHDRQVFRVAAAWATDMGGVATTAVAQRYFDLLQPRCLAMCGVCAGRRGEVNLGDVIVADRAWSYNFGASTTIYIDEKPREGFQADITTYQVPAYWKQEIASFQPDPEEASGWMSLRPIPYELQLNWILARLYAKESPADHPDRREHCPDYSRVLERHEKLPEAERLFDEHVELTEKGARYIERLIRRHPDGLPRQGQFKVHMGVIGTGDQVVRDERIFERLAEHERKVIGLEMEAAAIGALAHVRDVPFLVMKGVMDHADPEKNDNFKKFAARASAECLLAFLRAHLFTPAQPARGAASRPRPPEIDLIFPPTRDLVQERVFSQNYDSVRQADYYSAAPTNSARSLIGRQRFDMLLSRTLVLTDTQVLDGRILQDVVLSDAWLKVATAWSSRIKDRPMIEIRARRATLHDAFAAFVAETTKQHLKPFEFSSLDPHDRLSVARRMAERPRDAVSSSQDVFREMLSAGAGGGEVERIREALSRWSESASAGAIRVVSWKNTYLECLQKSFATAGDAWKAELASSWARENRAQKLIEDIAGTGNRTHVYQLLRDVNPLPGSLGDEIVADLRRIRIWYDRYYNRAIAMQHDAASEWLCNVDDPFVFPEEQQISREGIAQHDGALMRRIRSEGRAVDVPTEFTERLAEMPGDEFIAFIEEHDSRLQQWWSEGDPFVLAAIVHALVKRLDRQGTPAPVEEWAESNRSAMNMVRQSTSVTDEPYRRVQVHFVVDDQSPNQQTSSHREPTS